MLLPSAGSAAQSTSYTETFMKNAAGWDFFHVIAEELRVVVERLQSGAAHALVTVEHSVSKVSGQRPPLAITSRPSWSIDDVCAMLDELGLGKWKGVFRDSQVAFASILSGVGSILIAISRRSFLCFGF